MERFQAIAVGLDGRIGTTCFHVSGISRSYGNGGVDKTNALVAEIDDTNARNDKIANDV